jgi:hypothetical protein
MMFAHVCLHSNGQMSTMKQEISYLAWGLLGFMNLLVRDLSTILKNVVQVCAALLVDVWQVVATVWRKLHQEWKIQNEQTLQYIYTHPGEMLLYGLASIITIILLPYLIPILMEWFGVMTTALSNMLNHLF